MGRSGSKSDAAMNRLLKRNVVEKIEPLGLDLFANEMDRYLKGKEKYLKKYTAEPYSWPREKALGRFFTEFPDARTYIKRTDSLNIEGEQLLVKKIDELVDTVNKIIEEAYL